MSDLANIPNVFQAAVAKFGPVQAVVSNAAYSLLGAEEELGLAAIRHIVDMNLIGSVELARARWRICDLSVRAASSKYQAIRTFSHSRTLALLRYRTGYRGILRGLSQEVDAFGIGVTLVEPGAIRTDFGASSILTSPAL